MDINSNNNNDAAAHLSSRHLAETGELLSQGFRTWAVTTLTIFFGVFLLLRCLRGRKPLRPSQQVTIVVDQKEGIRELNPNYTVSCEESMACNSTIYDSICLALLDHLEKHPELPVFGSHAKPTDPYQWINYRQFFDMLKEFGSGLKHKFGIAPGTKTMMGIYSVNCLEWVTAHYGMLFYSNIAVPLYSTLGEEAMIHIVKLTEMTLCLCLNEERAESLMNMMVKGPSSQNKLRHLVIMKPKSAECMAGLREKFAAQQVQFHTFDDVREAGRKEILPFVIPKDNDMYVLNFTSGTTGVPKGVIITCGMFQHVITSVLCSRNILNRWMDQDDVYFSFLPLAHVLEQTLMAASIFVRARVGFYSGDMNKIMEDMHTLKPTMMALVPRLLLRIYDATLVKLAQKHIPKCFLNFAVKCKLQTVASRGRPVHDTIWDRFLFKGLQEKLGGRLRLVLTGGSACPHEVLNFARAAFGAVIHQGYGSTETGGAVALTFADDVSPEHVGAILNGSQVKLADVPEMDLYPSRNPSNPRGEICMRGPNCTPGYYMDKEKTAELIDKDGWLHTGDVGEWDEYGRLKVVDRCKNIFKLSQGEYIAPEKVENVYLTCPLIVQAFLDGKSDSIFAIGIIHPDGSRLAEKLGFKLKRNNETEVNNSDGRPVISLVDLCSMREAETLVIQELTRIGKENGLASFELAKKILLVPEPFSVEKGLMTATLKPVRAKIREHFATDIRRMYASGF